MANLDRLTVKMIKDDIFLFYPVRADKAGKYVLVKHEDIKAQHETTLKQSGWYRRCHFFGESLAKVFFNTTAA